MPTIRVRTDVAAAGTFFPLQGNQYEYLPFNARVEFALVGQATTAADIDGITATIYSGSDILQQRGPVSNKSNVTGQTNGAVYPDDFLLDDVAAAGERLSVELNVPAAGAAGDTVDTVVKITPL